MLNLSINEIQNKVRAGELTYEALTLYYLQRIERYNHQVNAVSEINPNALTQARALDAAYKEEGLHGQLQGMPVMIKDNINIASDGLHTTAGAHVLSAMKASYDATIVDKLKKAGAIILGKTNLTEFANFISEGSPNGYSALKGQVLNPYGPFDVGGSSSGSAVAVACGFCQVAIGTETSGSIISPSSANSIVGLKPSVGVASRYGIVPISATQDVPGPMARCVEDLAMVESVIEGFDPMDPSTKALLHLHQRAFDLVLPKPLKGLRIGVYEGESPTRKAADLVFDEAIAKMKGRGLMTEVVNFDPKDYQVNWDVLYYEFPRDIKAYLSTVEDSTDIKSLEDIVEFNKEDQEKHLPFDQKIFEEAIEKQESFADSYEAALRDSYNYGEVINRWLKDWRLDVVCYVHCDGTDIAARNGHPSITLPIGYTEEGAPVGFTITGPLFSEKLLLALAKALTPIIGEHKDIEFTD